MRYIIERAFQKLWLNRRAYFFLFLELTIGLTVSLCGISSSLSAQDRLAVYETQYSVGDVAIEYYANGFVNEVAITWEDYSNLLERYGDQCSFSYFLYANSFYQDQEDGGITDVTLLSINSATFARLFRQEQQEAIYVGKGIADALAEGEVLLGESWIQIDKDSAQVGERKIEQILPLSTELETLVTWALPSFDLSTSKVIILPESLMKTMETEADDVISFLCLTPDQGADVGFLSELTETLGRQHDGYTYTFTNQGAALKQSIADLTQGIRLLGWVAWLVLAITTAGITGILFLFLQQRRREYAIAMTQGATRSTIFLELFWEVLMLCGSGGIIAALISVGATPYLSTSMFTATFHWVTVPVMVLTVMAIAACPCVCVLSGLGSIYPAKTLRN